VTVEQGTNLRKKNKNKEKITGNLVLIMLFHEDSNFYEKPGVSVSCFIHNVHCLGGACGPQANIYSFPHNLIY